MTDEKRFLALDLGAESGRGMLATLRDGKIELEEAHRFRTQGLVMLGARQWDLARLHEEILTAMRQCARLLAARGLPNRLDGISIDTWGVDFGFIDAAGQPLGNPAHYRDRRTQGMIEEAEKIVPPREMYERTGIRPQSFNTLYQFLALARAKAWQLETASQMLFVGNLLMYLLCGKPSCETTMASTTQMINPATGQWDLELLKRLGIPTHFLPPMERPGRVLGGLTEEVAAATGLSADTPVIVGAIHDTAAAVAAVPVTAGSPADWAYLSSGTWSLLGVELERPLLSEAAREALFTNEGGLDGSIRFIKSSFGLWIVQECRRAWLAETPDAGGLDYAALTRSAEAAAPFHSVISLEDTRLMAPDNMPAAIATLCREAGQPVPATHGEFIRCALESLAVCYGEAVRNMNRVLGRNIAQLHIIGGGSQNRLLNQWTADACGIPVLAGPVEATALGNVLSQCLAIGAISSLPAGREIVARSFPVERFEPHP